MPEEGEEKPQHRYPEVSKPGRIPGEMEPGEKKRDLFRRLIRGEKEGAPPTETLPPTATLPPEGEPPVPIWVKERWEKEKPQILKTRKKSQYKTVGSLIDTYRDCLNRKEAANQPFTDTDYGEFTEFRNEIHSFLADPKKSDEDRARALWLRYEGEARIRLQRFWQESWYSGVKGESGIGKTIENAKDDAREILIEHYAALLTIPEVAKAMGEQKGYIQETDLYGFERIGHHLRRVGLTGMFADAIEKGVGTTKTLKIPYPHPQTPDGIKVKIYKPGIGTDHEFAPYRVLRTFPWAENFHPPEEWYRLIEPELDLDGNVIKEPELDLDGNVIKDAEGKVKYKVKYKDRAEFGCKYDLWHDPGKARFYILNWERIGEANREMLLEGVGEDEEKGFMAKLEQLRAIYREGRKELKDDETREFGDAVETIKGNLIRLCQDHEKFLKLEEVKWEEIFSDYRNFMKRYSGLANDLLTNYLVNACYMEKTQSLLFGEEGYLIGAPDWKRLRKLEQEGFQHLSKEGIREEVESWYQEFSDMLYATFDKATGANRGAELAGGILQGINQGVDRQFYRRYVFRACGIEGKDWTNIHQLRLTPAEKIRLVLQHLPFGFVWEKGIFDSKRGLFKKYNQYGEIEFKELVAAAGWRLEGDKIFSPEDEIAKEKERLKRPLTEAEKDEIKESYEEWAKKEVWAEGESKKEYILGIFQVDSLTRIIEKRQLDRLIDTAVDWYLDLAIRRKGGLDELRNEIGLEDRIDKKTWEKIKRYLPGLKKREWWQDLAFVGETLAGARSRVSQKMGGNRRFGRRWAPMNDLWTREKLFWLIKRETMRYAVGEGKDRWILRQLDKDELKNKGVFAAVNPLRAKPREMGTERIANLLMGAGETLPGSIHRLSPMYLYYDRTRLLWHKLAAWSVGYWEQAAEDLGLDWNNLQMWRAVMNPEKHLKIIDMLRGHEIISEKEKEGWMVALGCEETNQVWGFKKERKGFLIPDIEGKITPEGVQEGAEKLLTGLAGVAGPAAPAMGIVRTLVPIPRSLKETMAIARVSIPLGLTALRFIAPLLAPLPFTILATGPAFLAGALIGAHLGKDRGDDIKGIPSIFFGPLSLKGFRRFFPLWNGRGGKRQIRSIATWATPVWDDLINPEPIINSFLESKKHLGDQASYRG